jgi:hypothetical protein
MSGTKGGSLARARRGAVRLAPLGALLLALQAGMPAARAAPAGVVEGLQSPAWVLRAEQRRPVRAGMRIEPGDTLTTGPSGRLLLRLEEGSHVKLGEEARFRVESFTPPDRGGGLFESALGVLRGAFRFTTTLASRRHRRAIDVSVSTVTVGIRGTDIWGRSTAEQDLVCLIDGRITVRRGDAPPLEMSEPLTFYVAPRGRPAKPVESVSEEQLAQWAAETELTEGQGVARMGGRWVTSVASLREARRAQALAERLRERGYPVEVTPVTVAGVDWQRLVIPGLAGRQEAEALARRLAEAGFPPGWVYQQKGDGGIKQ